MIKPRLVLLMPHASRVEAMAVVNQARELLISAGLTPVLMGADLDTMTAAGLQVGPGIILFESGQKFEACLVLGGDGSILRAAEFLRGQEVPILGVNLGHVGFMAEAEREGLSEAISALATGVYRVRQRMTLEVIVFQDGVETYRSWALNEVTLEKNARERMLEVVLEIDGRPLSSFGCDGMVVSTPTGSTAYAFSAGGPVIWPSVEALLVIPLSAHALFARPLVLDSNAVAAIEVLRRSPGAGVLWCDGRRTYDLPPGSRVEVRKSSVPVLMVVFDDSPFTDRLVRKFSLPVIGWRGAGSAN